MGWSRYRNVKTLSQPSRIWLRESPPSLFTLYVVDYCYSIPLIKCAFKHVIIVGKARLEKCGSSSRHWKMHARGVDNSWNDCSESDLSQCAYSRVEASSPAFVADVKVSVAFASQVGSGICSVLLCCM